MEKRVRVSSNRIKGKKKKEKNVLMDRKRRQRLRLVEESRAPLTKAPSIPATRLIDHAYPLNL